MSAPLGYAQVNRDLLGNLLGSPTRRWCVMLGCDVAVLAFGVFCWGYQISAGLGVTGLAHPVGWGVYITNFVFWVGIAHSGTLISAVLFLFRARWRTSVARSAEAMTIFAVMTAGLFPIIHLGRAWNFYWLLPYPNQRDLWVNFQSPLVWDAFAISTYFAVSLMFWYVGLIPDLAAARDRTEGVRRKLYGFFALGWQGTDGQWHHYAAAYGLFAALATPLVVSVHSVVSWDFAMSLVPGWHSTIFAPYFVAGAIFSGLGMVLTLIIPLRHVFGLHAYVTADHFDNLGKLLIVTSLILTYSYVSEFFIAWYSANPYERSIFWFRAAGDYAPLFWLMVACNCAVPLLLFRRSIRTHTGWLFGISLLVNVGMWLERFVIIVSSLAHEFDPSAWGGYLPSWVEVGVTLGSFAWFFLFFLLFVRFLPLVSLAEVKEQLPPQDPTTVRVSTVGAFQAGGTSARREGRVEDGRSSKGRSEAGLVGVFRHADALTDAIRTLRRDGHSVLRVVAPFPSHTIEAALPKRKSSVRYFTLAGGLLGCAAGFALPTYTAMDWPLQTSAKPIVALPAFAVIAFELTILFGAVATLIGLFVNARLPAKSPAVRHDPRFSEDRFGLFVACDAEQRDMVRTMLSTDGAEEVYEQAG